MSAAALTPAARFELIRAAVHYHGDVQGTRRVGELLARLGYATPPQGSSRRYKLTEAGTTLAHQLAALDVRIAARRMAEEGQLAPEAEDTLF